MGYNKDKIINIQVGFWSFSLWNIYETNINVINCVRRTQFLQNNCKRWYYRKLKKYSVRIVWANGLLCQWSLLNDFYKHRGLGKSHARKSTSLRDIRSTETLSCYATSGHHKIHLGDRMSLHETGLHIPTRHTRK